MTRRLLVIAGLVAALCGWADVADADQRAGRGPRADRGADRDGHGSRDGWRGPRGWGGSRGWGGPWAPAPWIDGAGPWVGPGDGPYSPLNRWWQGPFGGRRSFRGRQGPWASPFYGFQPGLGLGPGPMGSAPGWWGLAAEPGVPQAPAAPGVPFDPALYVTPHPYYPPPAMWVVPPRVVPPPDER